MTADFVYLRFHGQTRLYGSCYDDDALRAWAERIRAWRDAGLELVGAGWHALCFPLVMDWSLVDTDRLAKLACPSCQRGLAGGLMRQVEWTTRRCIVVVACPNCNAESMVVLETSGMRRTTPPIDVDDVRRAHDVLARAGRMSDLFPI